MKIVILHPDLGIGGAERLVVDVAIAFKSKGHEVHFVTNHHDPKHCFPETNDFPVHIVGSRIPRHLKGNFHAIMAYLKLIYAAIWLVFFSNLSPDLVFCDQVSVCIPFLKRSKAKILYYCHFPDQLLAKRTSWIKALYRFPLDYFEEKTTGMADKVFVNSKFTGSVFKRTFKSLAQLPIEVLYPSLCMASFDQPLEDRYKQTLNENVKTIFLSLNRYEHKKNISLAIHAFNELVELLQPKEKLSVHLFIAGGYDERVSENIECFLELKNLVHNYKLDNQVSFFKSPSHKEKLGLLNTCTAVLYTPANEHFGIVPLEAMYMSRPVIAANSGGPLETIENGETGFLCEQTKTSFAQAMHKIATDQNLVNKMGIKGKEHVLKNFSFDTFVENVNKFSERSFIEEKNVRQGMFSNIIMTMLIMLTIVYVFIFITRMFS